MQLFSTIIKYLINLIHHLRNLQIYLIKKLLNGMTLIQKRIYLMTQYGVNVKSSYRPYLRLHNLCTNYI
jgi:hypothetical protein